MIKLGFSPWRRKWGLTAGESALLGLVIGWAVAIVAAFMPPRDFSLGFLSLMLLSIGPFGGTTGYIFWLACDPQRGRRLQEVASLLAVLTVLGSLVLMPGFWWTLGRRGPHFIPVFMGLFASVAVLVVGAGMGLVHLVRHLICVLGRKGLTRADRLWDRDLDQEFP
jgi:hypothetical protein